MASSRHYDDALKLVASVLFGTSVREFNQVRAQLTDLTHSAPLALGTAIVFFMVYFRNIHGLICFDSWVESADYRDPIERRTREVLRDFFFSFFGVLFLPYLFIQLLEHRVFADRAVWFAVAMFAPLSIYWVWNSFLLKSLSQNRLTCTSLAPTEFTFVDGVNVNSDNMYDKIIDKIRDCIELFRSKVINVAEYQYEPTTTPPPGRATSRRRFQAYNEMLLYVKTWSTLDVGGILFIVSACYLSTLGADVKHEYLPKGVSSMNVMCVLCFIFCSVGLMTTLLDYAFNIGFYFPKPKSER